VFKTEKSRKLPPADEAREVKANCSFACHDDVPRSICKFKTRVTAEQGESHAATLMFGFIMERIEGKTLHEYLQFTNRKPEATVNLAARLSIAIDVVKAVQHIHAKGWLHLDIKPANIMIVQEAADGVRVRAVLSDFGTATPKEDWKSVNVSRGTLEYQPDGRRQSTSAVSAVNEYTDVFALSVTLYELFMRERFWNLGLTGNETPVQREARFKRADFPTVWSRNFCLSDHKMHGVIIDKMQATLKYGFHAQIQIDVMVEHLEECLALYETQLGRESNAMGKLCAQCCIRSSYACGTHKTNLGEAK
jgi:serine/threonine protein kinase